MDSGSAATSLTIADESTYQTFSALIGWLEEQRRAHQAEKDRLDGELDGALSEKDTLGKELAESRAKEKEACAKAAELRRRLDECLKLAAEAAKAAAEPPAPAEPAPPPAGGPAPPPPSPPPSSTAGPHPPDEEKVKGCKDGDERWREFDGPHPFTIPTDEIVKVTIVLISGTRRGARIGSLDRADFVNLDDRGQTAGIPFHVFESLGSAEIRGGFSGKGGLAELWETAGAGAVQRLSLTLSYGKRSVRATCERKEVCVDGQWQPQSRWRPRVSGDPEMVSDSITVQGNVEAGVGVAEESYLDALVAFFSKTQGKVRTLMSAKEAYDKYQRDCKAGRR